MDRIRRVLGINEEEVLYSDLRLSGKKKAARNAACGRERCVVCGALTDIPTDAPVSERKWYVPGGGQLCRKCCIELYGTDDLRSLQSAELEQMFLRR